MDSEEILTLLTSEDSSNILDAVSEILHSNDKSLLANIAPYVADIKKVSTE